MSPPRSLPQSPLRWGLIVLLGALTAFAPMSIDMYLPALPALQQSLGVNAEAGQSTLAAFLAGMAIGQFFYGPASDRFGRRGPILIGIAVYTLASAACALAGSLQTLVLMRFVQALGGCAGSVVARAVVRDRFDHTETARMLSLLMLVMGLAPIFAPMAGALILLVGGWRMIFWALAAFGLLTGLAVAFGLSESRSAATAIQARSEHPLRAFATLLRARRLVGYGLAGALNGAVLFSYIAASPGLIMGTYGLSAQIYPWIFGANAVAIIGANQVNRALLHRFTPDQVLNVASHWALAFGVALLLAAWSGLGGPFIILPLLFAVLASFGLMQGNTMAGALSVDPLRAGSISALMGGASFGTGAVASWLSGLLHDGTARPMALIMVIALLGSTLALNRLALVKSPRQG